MSLGAQLRELFDGLGELTAQHIRLAKLELQDNARFVGARVAVIAALAPLVLVGYGFLCVAGALALSRVLAVDLAFLIVGAVNLVGAVAGIAIAGKQLGGTRFFTATVTELEETRAVVLHRRDDTEGGASKEGAA
ncbi:MAG: phage holin family protein [Myxococcota bacterium]